MSETPESSPQPADAQDVTQSVAPESLKTAENETLPAEPESEPVSEKTEAEKPEVPAMSVTEYAHELDPPFLTPEIREQLDRMSGLADDNDDRPMRDFEFGSGQGESLAQGPSFDSSLTANRLREIIYGDGEHPGLLQNRAKLAGLKKPVDYERTLVKEYYNEKEQLEHICAQQFQDLCALADHHFNDPSKYQGPVIQNNFQASANVEVTITMILDRIGIPEEAPEPEEMMNPSRIAARSS